MRLAGKIGHRHSAGGLLLSSTILVLDRPDDSLAFAAAGLLVDSDDSIEGK